MQWKKQLRNLERNKRWDDAISFMQFIIESDPNDMDAYIYMNFLIMNLLVEEDYDESKHDYYAALLKKYFDISYVKFSNNAEYLFYTGITAVMSEWYFGINAEIYQQMLSKAMKLSPDNLLYRRTRYIHLSRKVPSQRSEAIQYAKLVLDEHSPIIKELEEKGAIGEYLKDCIQSRAIEDLTLYSEKQK